MPFILPEEHHDSWLSGEAGKEVLVPYPADRMKAWPVSARVNSPKNNDAEIIVPVEVQSADLKILRDSYRDTSVDVKDLVDCGDRRPCASIRELFDRPSRCS
jgi:hypothetical protein